MSAGLSASFGPSAPGVSELADDYCCAAGCGDGGCESCPCCIAGWCIGFADGVPNAGYMSLPDAQAGWDFDWWTFLVLDERGFAAIDPGPRP